MGDVLIVMIYHVDAMNGVNEILDRNECNE